jgi:hypothetical protein
MSDGVLQFGVSETLHAPFVGRSAAPCITSPIQSGNR